MSSPKVTYSLMSQSLTISFSMLKYSTLKQGWKPDIVEFKNPFSGRIKRVFRGWYYHAEIFYEAMTDDDFLLLRDLWNKNISDVKFYPNDVEVRNFPVDVNVSGLDFQDKYPDMETNITVSFDSVDRYDSPVEYPANYWGARQIRFTDDATWGGHMAALNTADSNNLTSFVQRTTNFFNHIDAADPHASEYYTKDEIDAPRPARRIFIFGGQSDGSANAFLNAECGVECSWLFGPTLNRSVSLMRIGVRIGASTEAHTDLSASPKAVIAGKSLGVMIFPTGGGNVAILVLSTGQLLASVGPVALSTMSDILVTLECEG